MEKELKERGKTKRKRKKKRRKRERKIGRWGNAKISPPSVRI